MAYERFKAPGSTPTALRIERLPHGGYVVTDQPGRDCFVAQLFASSEIDGALGFIKGQLEPRFVASVGLSEEDLKAAVVRPDGVVAVTKNGQCPHCGLEDGLVDDGRCIGDCRK
jgi:hypothetical protein